MNEKIKELAEQCYEKHELLGTYEFNKEKFTELIVQECAEISENYATGSMPVSIALAIKEHFGVK